MTDKIITDKEVLAQVSRPTTPEECRELDIFNRLEALLSAYKINGIGLAAIQIGIPIQAAIIRTENYSLDYMNPKVGEVAEPFLFQGEGCLSVPDKYVTTMRYRYITVSYTKADGTNEDPRLGNLPAIVFQHELDHMAGKLFLCHEFKPKPIKRDEKKVGRNDPCPCGCGQKSKKCTGVDCT